MNRNLYLIFILIFLNLTYGQKFESKIDSIVKIEIKNLKKSGIAEVGFVNLTCVNYGIFSSVFLFWSNGNKTYIQKFKNSEYDKNSFKKYKPIQIKDTIFFSFFKLNRNRIQNEKVLPFQYYKDSLDEKNGIINRIISMHTCNQYFEIEVDNHTYKYKYDYFDTKEFDNDKIDNSKLSKKEIDNWKKKGWEVDTTYENKPNRNINFTKNKDLIILSWKKKIDKLVELLEKQNKFIIQK